MYCGKGDQCPHAAVSLADLKEPSSSGPILKETGWLTNSPLVFGPVTKQCTTRSLPRDSPQRHTHVQLLSGRAKFAEHYPEALVNAILKAVREELRSRSLLNFGDASSGSSEASCPSSLLPHVDEDSLAVPAPEYWDEIAGTKLDSKLVQNARAEEIQ